MHKVYLTILFYLSASLLRNELIDRLTASESFHWNQREFLLLLLNTQTKSLDLSNFKKDSAKEFHQEFLPFLSQVILRVQNLLRLSFNENYCHYIDRELFPDAIKTSILNKIVELKSLQHLNLFGYFVLDSDDLMLLTKNLKNLVILKV